MLILGYVLGGVSCIVGGVAAYKSNTYGKQVRALQDNPPTSLEALNKRILASGHPQYACVVGAADGPADKQFVTKYTNTPNALVCDTSVMEEYDERHVSQTATPIFGTAAIMTQHTDWETKTRELDRSFKGDAFYLTERPASETQIKFPMDYFKTSPNELSDATELHTEVRLPGEAQTTGANNITIINDSGSDVRVKKRIYYERVIRKGLPITALGEFYTAPDKDALAPVEGKEVKAVAPPLAVHWRRPESTTGPYILSTKTVDELKAQSKKSATNWTVGASIAFGLGALLLGGTGYFHVQSKNN